MDEELQALIDAAENERDESEEASNTDDDITEDENGMEDADDTESGSDDSLEHNDSDGIDSDDSDDEDDSEDGAQQTGDGEEGESDGEVGDDSSGFQEIQVEVDGRQVTLNSMEEVKALVARGMKVQDSKGESTADMYYKQGNVSDTDMQLIIDAKAGNPAALAKIAQMGNIDTMDLDEIDPNSYQAQFQLTEVSPVEKAAEEIMRDETNATAFRNTMSTLPQSFQTEVTSDGERMLAFARHVKSGLAEEIIPLAMKKVAMNGGDFFQAYATIGSEIMAGRENRDVATKPKAKKTMSKREKQIRNRATASRGSSSTNTGKSEAEEVEAMSDAEFEKMISSTRR